MAKLNAAEIIKDYNAAYEAANRKPAPPIEYERGWFRMKHDNGYSPRYRAAKLVEMGGRLLERSKLGGEE